MISNSERTRPETMNTNYAAPVATYKADCFVPAQDFVKVLMVWTLRSMNPVRDQFTTISYSIQFDGVSYRVVELVDGTIPQDFNLGGTFDSADAALAHWGEMVRCATPPCTQGVLPGMIEASANFVETYAYFGGYGGAPCEQSHARVGSYS